MRTQTLELIAYTAASGAALLVDIGLLGALVDLAGWPYLAAAATSFVTGGVCLYTLSVKFVFRFRRIANRTLELPLFLGLGLAGLAINTAVMFIAVETCHMHYLFAKAAAAGCTFSTNFLLRKSLMFARVAQPQ